MINKNQILGSIGDEHRLRFVPVARVVVGEELLLVKSADKAVNYEYLVYQ